MSSKLMANARLRAFTLIEILVVLGIITLVAALGVPVFNALSGARSTEAGRNVVAAALGQARTIAVNEGRFAGVLFYVDPATERTAMSIVIVDDPNSSLEDADPYDKYKGWFTNGSGPQYRGPSVGGGNGQSLRGDRVIAMTANFNSTYRVSEYTRNPMASEYLKFFGNYRPEVKTFRCKSPLPTNAADVAGVRPPRNGPLLAVTSQYQTAPSAAIQSAPAPESSAVAFTNGNWGLSLEKDISSYFTGEQQLLPKGVGVQVITQPTARPDVGNAPAERYVRTGCIMFDSQGRLVMKNFALSRINTLGKFLDLANDATNIVSGLGVVLYDQQNFKAYTTVEAGKTYRTSEADFLYTGSQATNEFAIVTAPGIAAFNDYPAPPTDPARPGRDEELEEAWLDNNTIPLLINRFSGSLSEAE